jgi:GTPase
MSPVKNEVKIAVIGHVDAGKSTTVSVLISDQLDDGNGKAREVVLKHKHEKTSGRSSSISYNHKIVNDKAITFIDLCGHEKYLKSTVLGLTNSFSDYSMLVIGVNRGITDITKQHLILSLSLKVPIFTILTKIDLCSEHIYNQIYNKYTKLLKETGFKGYLVNNEQRLKNAINFLTDSKNKKIPIFHISNKTGKGLDLMKQFIHELHPSGLWKKFTDEEESLMYIDQTYTVPGVGLVLSGTVRKGVIKKGDILFIGPFSTRDDKYKRVIVKTVHNNVRQLVLQLNSGDTGCLAVRPIKCSLKRHQINKGCIVSSKEQPATQILVAELYILKTNRTTIKNGFEGVFYCRNVKCSARIQEIYNKKNKKIEYLRAGHRAYVKFELITNGKYIEKKSKIIFREGLVKAVGKVYKCL